jgi:hypothetical protein
MDPLLEFAGIALARAYAMYGLALLAMPAVFFLDLMLLAVVVWAVACHTRGRWIFRCDWRRSSRAVRKRPAFWPPAG